VRVKRLTAATLAISAIVFGCSVLVANSRAQGGTSLAFTCSAADKQFVGTVSTNLVQLGYWSDSLVNHDVAPAIVVKQARAEAQQVSATRPEDRTLHATRDLLSSMFLEYSKAVALTMHGRDPSARMQNAWRLAHSVHDLLAGAQSGLAAQGCDVSPLLKS
jgi:hypothetical protein